MKVYLAAPYSRKDQIKAYSEELHAWGIDTTSSWVDEPHVPDIQMHELTHQDHQKYAERDVADIVSANCLILFTDPTKTIVRAGRHVEFGIALGLREAGKSMLLWVVGSEFENIFHHLSGITRFQNWGAAKVALRAMDEMIKADCPF